MRRILFVSEAVTLAQVVRLVALARALDPTRYEVHFASARFDELVFHGTGFVRHPIWSLSPEVVDRRVARGQRLYGMGTLAATSATIARCCRLSSPAWWSETCGCRWPSRRRSRRSPTPR